MNELWCVYVTKCWGDYEDWHETLHGNLKFSSVENVDAEFQKAKDEVDRCFKRYMERAQANKEYRWLFRDFKQKVESKEDRYVKWNEYPNGNPDVVYTAIKVKVTDGSELSIF